jgi:hypothetical protein
MPAIGRLLGIFAGFLATWLTEQGYGQVDEKQLFVIFMSAYAGAHTLYRTWRARRDKSTTIKPSELPKGTL